MGSSSELIKSASARPRISCTLPCCLSSSWQVYSHSISGFGLALCKSHKLVWSTLGYNVLITALSIQTFFLVNAFWTKLVIYKQNITNFDTNPNRVYLTASELTTETHSTLTEALKCSLSCIVAFSFINGRAGILEVFSVTITGTIVY